MNNYAFNIPPVEVNQKEWTPPEAPKRTYGRLEAREECDQNGPRWDLVKVDGGTIARDLVEDTAKRLAACWNRSEGFSTDLMAHPMAPRFIDQLFAMGSMHNRMMYQVSEVRAGAEKLRNALKEATFNMKPDAWQMKGVKEALAHTLPAALNAIRNAPEGTEWIVTTPDGTSRGSKDREYVERMEADPTCTVATWKPKAGA